MMKLRIATGLGLLLFMATMIGGPIGLSQAQADEVTLADLAGKFAGRGSGFFTLCFDASISLVDCASAPPHVVPFNFTLVEQFTRDAAGSSCGVFTETVAPVSGTKSPVGVNTRIDVGTSISFDPTTGSGKESFSLYFAGSCTGATFHGDGTSTDLAATGTRTFVVSDSGNRIEIIYTSVSSVTNRGNVAGALRGFVFSQTAIRQGHPSE